MNTHYCSACGWKPLKEGRCWEVIDATTAQVFHAGTPEARDSFTKAIDLVGHDSIVREHSA